MDALTLLIADHNRVRGLFARFKEAKESENVLTMRDVVTRITEDLEIHTTIEEEIFYPAVSDLKDEIHELVKEGIEEHHVAKSVLGELATVQPGGEEWIAKVTVLIEAVEHHAGEEEKEMFPKVRSSTDADARNTLGDKLQERKLQLGAPPPAIDLSKEELATKATEQAIPGRSKMSKDELALTVDPR
jgi:hemerythrin superfamily protein